LAYGEGTQYFPLNKLLLEVKDPSKIVNNKDLQSYADWIKENGFCYELIVPAAKAKLLFKIMQHDLSVIFSEYDVKVEKRKINCITLIRTSTIDKLKSKGGTPSIDIDPYQCQLTNTFLSHFFRKIETFYLQDSPMPIINATGYTGKIDFKIKADMANIVSLNKALEKYDLKFIQQEQEIDMLVIKDQPN
jgi:hypothetical protein